MRHFAFVAALAAIAAASTAFAAPDVLSIGQIVEGELTTNDSPRDDGGVSRDYKVEALSGQFLIVSLTSEDFDGIVTIFNPDRSKAIENDDRVEGNLNPLAVLETAQDGIYTIRVGSFGGGEKSVGKYKLKVMAFSE